jgi:hypothetical protein
VGPPLRKMSVRGLQEPVRSGTPFVPPVVASVFSLMAVALQLTLARGPSRVPAPRKVVK